MHLFLLSAKLSDAELRRLGDALCVRTFRIGYKMIVEGDIGNHCFIIKEVGSRKRSVGMEERVNERLILLLRLSICPLG